MGQHPAPPQPPTPSQRRPEPRFAAHWTLPPPPGMDPVMAPSSPTATAPSPAHRRQDGSRPPNISQPPKPGAAALCRGRQSRTEAPRRGLPPAAVPPLPRQVGPAGHPRVLGLTKRGWGDLTERGSARLNEARLSPRPHVPMCPLCPGVLACPPHTHPGPNGGFGAGATQGCPGSPGEFPGPAPRFWGLRRGAVEEPGGICCLFAHSPQIAVSYPKLVTSPRASHLPGVGVAGATSRPGWSRDGGVTAAGGDRLGDRLGGPGDRWSLVPIPGRDAPSITPSCPWHRG